MLVYRHIAEKVIKKRDQGYRRTEIALMLELSQSQVQDTIKEYRTAKFQGFKVKVGEHRDLADIFLKGEATHPDYYRRVHFGVFER